MRDFYIAAAILIIFIFTGCSGTRNRSSEPLQRSAERRDLAYIYNPSELRIHPAIKIFHTSEEQSNVLVKLFTSELLFNSANPENRMQANVKIHYQLYQLFPPVQENALIDSATYAYTIEDNNTRHFETAFPVKARMPGRYMLRVYVHDVLRQEIAQQFVPVDKMNYFTNQNYKLTDGITNELIYNYILRGNKAYKISNNRQYSGKLYVHYYKNDSPLPPPVFSIYQPPKVPEKADSLWVYNYTQSSSFMFPYEGLYHIQTDTSEMDGLTLYNFGKRYPQVTTPEELVAPLAYITNSEEYKQLMAANNTKLAVDEFWINTTGSLDAARELLRVYYNRVFFANYFFPSDREGWKTDRGMVYLVFGPPNAMYKSNDKEKWVYFQKQRNPELEFLFLHENSPLSNSIYNLERDDALNYHWKKAVASWRSGKPYIISD